MKSHVRFYILIPLLAQMIFLSCRKMIADNPTPSERIFNLPAFNSVYSSDAITISIQRSDRCLVFARGKKQDIAKLYLTVFNDVLDISALEAIEEPVDIIVQLPLLENLRLAGGSKGFVSGFGGQSIALNVTCSGKSFTSISGIPPQTNAEAGGFAILEFAGTTHNLNMRAFGDSRINGYRLEADNADIKISERSEAHVKVDSSITGIISGDARLYYKGNPVDCNFQILDNGKVFHE
jgi:hypothetical protein